MTKPEKMHHLTDLGNEERFIAREAADIRFVPAWRKWLVWAEGRWAVDELSEVYRKGVETVKSIWKEIANGESADERADIAVHAKHSEAEPRIRAMLTIAEHNAAVVVRPADLDRDPWLLGTQNGVFNLKTGEFRPAERRDLITKSCGTRFDPGARSPRWEAFLERIQPSEEVRGYLQRAVGYWMTGNTGEQAMFLHYGAGANGKTVYLKVIGSLFGEYGAVADFGTFLERRNDGPRTDLARLEGVRFVSASEASQGRRLDESVVKQYSGGDTVVARALYQAERQFTPIFKLCLSANHKPQIRGTDYAIWRRVHLIPFAVTIPEEERRKDLADTLRDELPGILNWALEGCREWQRWGLQAPNAVRAATEEYRVESDILGVFIAEKCVKDSGAVTPASELYETYKQWAESGREGVLNRTLFGRELTQLGFRAEKIGTVRRFGIRLRRADEMLETVHESTNGQLRTDRPLSVNSLHARAVEKVPELGFELSTVQASENGQCDQFDHMLPPGRGEAWEAPDEEPELVPPDPAKVKI